MLAAGLGAMGAAAPASSAATEWAWPVRGSVITSYANENSRPYAGGMHRGIDIAARAGATVTAAQAGTVAYAGLLGSSGLTIAINTADGRYVTSYLHLRKIAVERGEPVGTGQKVGEVGTSGQRSATEPHLHFGVRIAGRKRFYVDPLTLLPPLQGAKLDVPVPAAPRAVRKTAAVRAQAAPVRARAAPVPVGPRAVPGIARPRLAPPVTQPVPELRPLPAGRPIAWGPLVSLGGIALLGAVLARRFIRQERSGSIRGEHRAQPPARAAAVRPSRLGSVSQMG